MMNSMDKIIQSNVMGNWVFPLDWEVRIVLNTMQKDPSPQGIKMETKRTHLDPLGRNDKNQRSEGEGNVV